MQLVFAIEGGNSHNLEDDGPFVKSRANSSLIASEIKYFRIK